METQDITLRQFYAAHAIGGIIRKVEIPASTASEIAHDAFLFADAMIAHEAKEAAHKEANPELGL